MATQPEPAPPPINPNLIAEPSAYQDDNLHTKTSIEQKGVMTRLFKIFEPYNENPNDFFGIELFREKHKQYLLRGLSQLSVGYQGLDASRPWLCYWILHGLDLLDAVPVDQTTKTYKFLARCQHPKGGFCGGPGQLPHLAPTYAAMNSLVICDDVEAYKVIDRKGMYNFLMSMKSPTGGFTMHESGEVDVRGTYCALVAASILNIMTPELLQGAAEFVVNCQTYEGGIGAFPGNEAHGGYTFCGLAAMLIMGKADMLNLDNLLTWVVQRQMGFEGGFQGRTNKLVDSCYSFWQGAIYPLVQYALGMRPKSSKSDDAIPENSWLFDQQALQKYVLLACQDFEGGLKDKPGKGRDFYHTCYALSGLAVAQHNELDCNVEQINVEMPTNICEFGLFQNLVEIIHPVYNLRPERLARAMAYFKSLGPLN